MDLGSRMPTRPAVKANLVLLVGGERDLVETVRQAALYSSGAQLVETSIGELSTVATELRPYAILVPRDVYDFGGGDLAALARDVDAGLVVVSDAVQIEVLIASLRDEAARLG